MKRFKLASDYPMNVYSTWTTDDLEAEKGYLYVWIEEQPNAETMQEWLDRKAAIEEILETR